MDNDHLRQWKVTYSKALPDILGRMKRSHTSSDYELVKRWAEIAVEKGATAKITEARPRRKRIWEYLR